MADVNSDATLMACCGMVYDDLFAKNLEPAREDLVRDDESITALVDAIRMIWVEHAGGSPAAWPWNRGYVLKTYIQYRKKTRIEKDGLRKELSVGGLFPEVQGVVYFIRNSRGHIKIGHTDGDPLKRLAALQTGESETLSLAATTPGTQALERILHFRFALHRIRRDGEWFYQCPDIDKLIMECRQCQ